MEWLFAILVVLVLGAVAVVAAGRGEPMVPPEEDAPLSGLPTDRPLRPEDLRQVRFPLAVRGYRMADVDALLARLAEQWERPAPPGGSDPTRGVEDGRTD